MENYQITDKILVTHTDTVTVIPQEEGSSTAPPGPSTSIMFTLFGNF